MTYNAGDRVRVLKDNTNSTGLRVGDIVHVVRDKGMDSTGWDELYVTGKDGTPASGFETRGWFITRANVEPVKDPDFKVGDKVTPKAWPEDGELVIVGVTDTHVWAVSPREVEKGYSDPYYTYAREAVAPVVEKEPVWEDGKTYAYVSYDGTTSDQYYTVSSVDDAGYAVAVYKRNDRRYLFEPQDRTHYTEV